MCALDATKTRSEIHLGSQLLNRAGSMPNYALLIGAGASVSSKVPPATEMIREWRLEEA